MNTHALTNKAQRLSLRLTGKRVGHLVSANTNNAEEIASRYSGVKAKTLIESGGFTTLRPKHLPEDNLVGLLPFEMKCETVLLDIANTGFSFRNNLLHDPELNVIFADTFTESQVLAFNHYAPNCQHVKGTVAYLSNTNVDNYYHWMQLALPQLRFYRKLAPEVKIDYYYIGSSRLSRVQEETLSYYDITPNQILRAPCSADRLLIALYLHPLQHGGVRFRDPWGHKFVRSAVEIKSKASRRLYVSRGKGYSRQVLNENEVVAFLEKRGFESVSMNGLTVREQAEVFASAEVIVSTHGAALTNLLFAREGAKVVDIFPPGFHEASFFTAATHSKLDYCYMIGDGPDWLHQSINPHKLARVLDI